MSKVFSDSSQITAVTTKLDSFWLRNPLRPDTNVKVKVDPSFSAETADKSGVFYPASDGENGGKAVVVYERESRGEELSVTIWSLNEEDHSKIMRLLKSKETLLLSDVLGQQWYVSVAGAVSRERLHTGAHSHRIKARLIEVDRPTSDFIFDQNVPVPDLTPPGGGVQKYKKASLGLSPGSPHTYTSEELAVDFQSSAQFGAWLRIDLDWSIMQQVEGAPVDFTDSDVLVQAALDAGIRNFIMTLAYTPSWIRSGGSNKEYPPADRMKEYSLFIASCVERYKPGGSFGLTTNGCRSWEIWNEPNVPAFGFNEDGDSDPGRYALMFDTAVGAIRAEDPDAIILPGGPANSLTNCPSGSNRYSTAYNPGAPKSFSIYDWYRNLLLDDDGILAGNSPIRGKFDAIAIHAYWSVGSPIYEDPNPALIRENYTPIRYAPIYLWSLLAEAGEDLNKVRIWSTEGGVRGIPYWVSGVEYVYTAGDNDHSSKVFTAAGSPPTDPLGEWTPGSARYRCIQTHTSSNLNKPPNVSYWTVDNVAYDKEEDQQGWELGVALDYWFSPALADRVGPFMIYNARDYKVTVSGKQMNDSYYGFRTSAEPDAPEGRIKGTGVFAANGALQKLIAKGAEPDTR